MRYAVIEGTAVVNVIEAEEGFTLDGFTLVQTDTAGPGWTFHPGIETFSPPETAEPHQALPKNPALYAAATVHVEDAVVTNITANWNWRIAGCIWLDVGEYYVFLSEEIADAAYMAKAWDGAHRCFITDSNKFSDSFIVSVKDASGTPADPECFSLEVVGAI